MTDLPIRQHPASVHLRDRVLFALLARRIRTHTSDESPNARYKSGWAVDRAKVGGFGFLFLYKKKSIFFGMMLERGRFWYQDYLLCPPTFSALPWPNYLSTWNWNMASVWRREVNRFFQNEKLKAPIDMSVKSKPKGGRRRGVIRRRDSGPCGSVFTVGAGQLPTQSARPPWAVPFFSRCCTTWGV